MKKIIVNKDVCIGCGACVAIDDAHFTFDENGKSEVISQDNLTDNNLINALESCPVAAISIENANNCDDESCECEDKKDCNSENANNCNDESCECEDKKDCNCDNDDCECDGCHCEGCGHN